LVVLAVFATGVVLVRTLSSDSPEGPWRAAAWPGWTAGSIEDACTAGVCVADAVVLPVGRPVETAVDVEMPEELGALSVERVWVGERDGLFGAGWATVWDVELVDGKFVGPLPAEPAEAPSRNESVDLQGGGSVRVDGEGRLDEVCLDAAQCVRAEWSDDALELRTVLDSESSEDLEDLPAVTLSLEDGRVTGAATPDGRTVEYEYDGDLLVGVLRGESETTYEYEGSKLVSVDDGVRRTFTYDGFGQVASATDLDGELWTITAEAGPDGTAPGPGATTRRFEVESPDGWTRTYRFTRGSLVEVTDTELGVLLSRKVQDGRQVEERPQDGVTSTWVSNDELVVEQQVGEGPVRRVTYRYDQDGRVIRTETAEGTTEVTYDGRSDRPVEVRGPNGTSTMDYDDRGLLLASEDADGYQVEVERNALGQPVALADEVQRTEFAYDAAGRVIEERSGEARSRASYLDDGLLGSIELPSGQQLDASYDEFGRLESLGPDDVAASNPAASSDDVEEPPAPEIVASEDGRFEQRFPSGEVAVLDEAGRPVEVTVDGRTETRTYDDAGRLIKLALPGGPTYELTYTRAGRLASVDDGTLTATFSWHGDLLREVETSAGTSYVYDYDEAGQLVAATSGPLRWDYEYDELGRSSVVRGPAGVIRSRWDDRGRPAEVRDGGRTEEYQWAGDTLDLRRIEVDGERTLLLERDDAGRIVQVNRGEDDTANLTYDTEAGQLTGYQIGASDEVALTYRDGQVATIESGGRTETWTWADGKVTEVAVDGEDDPYRLDWLAPGLLGGVRQGDEQLLVAETDDAGRPVELTAQGDMAATLDWDATGLTVVSVTDGPTATLRRDDERRLTRVETDDRRIDWTYEDGALTRLRNGDRTTRFDYDDGRLNRTTHEDGDTESTIAWSPSGTLPSTIATPRGEVTFTYDEGRIDAIETPDGREPVRVEDGQATAEGEAGEILDALFGTDGRYLAPLGKTTAGPQLPWIDALPAELGVALPEVVTARQVIDSTLNEQLPDLPGFLLDDTDDLAERTALGLLAATTAANVPTGPDRVTPLGLDIDSNDLALDFAGGIDTTPIDIVSEVLKPNPSLVQQTLGLGGDVVGGVTGTITGGFRAVQRFLTETTVGRYVMTAVFFAGSYLSAGICAASVVCGVAVATGLKLASEFIAANPGQGLFNVVAAAALRPFGDLASAIRSRDLLAIALAGANVLSKAVPVGGQLLRTVAPRGLSVVCKMRAVVCVSRARFGAAAEHVAEAQRNGAARLLRIDRAGAGVRRADALRNFPARTGFDRDEYPFAVSSRRTGLSVRHIDPSSNRALGAYLRRQIDGRPDGAPIWVLPVA
jgi:YD repeat-containing protein